MFVSSFVLLPRPRALRSLSSPLIISFGLFPPFFKALTTLPTVTHKRTLTQSLPRMNALEDDEFCYDPVFEFDAPQWCDLLRDSLYKITS